MHLGDQADFSPYVNTPTTARGQAHEQRRRAPYAAAACNPTKIIDVIKEKTARPRGELASTRAPRATSSTTEKATVSTVRRRCRPAPPKIIDIGKAKDLHLWWAPGSDKGTTHARQREPVPRGDGGRTSRARRRWQRNRCIDII